MDNDIGENKFWIMVWAMVIGAIIIAIMIGVSYHIQTTRLIAEADNPIATACAISSSSDSKPCMAYLGSLK